MTSAVRVLRARQIAFEAHLYRYGGSGVIAKSAAERLDIPYSWLYKTIVFAGDNGPVLAMAASDRAISVKALTKAAGYELSECSRRDAERYTGYHVGGISPFGTRTVLPVYLDSEVTKLERVYVNGGSRGFIISVSPNQLIQITNAQIHNVAVAG